MPVDDKYHDNVVNALKKDGWQIVKEQVLITVGQRHLWVDLKAEKDNQLIYVEIKGFETKYSPVDYLENVVGQYVMYVAAIDYAQLEIPLYLAIPKVAYDSGILSEEVGQIAIKKASIKLIIFDVEREVILQWKT